ncbi:MAG: hypothetical protein K0S39_1856 [Paenibacillus sp.]|nr:hypothetical protein [Paenibacillus sp.]
MNLIRTLALYYLSLSLRWFRTQDYRDFQGEQQIKRDEKEHKSAISPKNRPNEPARN